MEPRALINIKSESYKYTFCNRLYGLQQQGLFCDLYLKSDRDESCPLHLCVAVAGSPFIKSVLDSVDASSNKTAVGFAIPLGDLSLAMLNVVTQFMYTGEIETEKEDLQNILQAAELLQMEDMVQALKKTIHELKSMDISKSEAVEHCTDSENKDVNQTDMLDEEGSPSGVRKSQRVRKSSKRFSDEYVMDQEKQKKPLKDSPKKTEQETLSASETEKRQQSSIQEEGREDDVNSKDPESEEKSSKTEGQTGEEETAVSGVVSDVTEKSVAKQETTGESEQSYSMVEGDNVEDTAAKENIKEQDEGDTDLKQEEEMDTDDASASQGNETDLSEGQKRKSVIDPRVLQLIRKKGRGKEKASDTESPQQPKKRKVGGSHGREKPYRRYTPEDMMKAYELCQEGMPIAKAARLMGIPKNTLYDRVHGNTKKGKFSPGPDRLFSTYEEVGMVRSIHMLAAYGFGCYMSEIRKLASYLAVSYGHRPKVNSKTGKPTLVSKRWTKEFFSRRSELRMDALKALANDRDRKLAKKTIENFYEELGITCENYDLEDKPEYLLRLEETQIVLPSKVKGVGAEGELSNVGSGERITVLSCYTAEGQILPPYFIVQTDDSEDFLQAGINYAVSPNGRPSVDTLQKYVEEHLIQYLLGDVGEQHTLILYDGCKSDICTSLVESSFGHKMVLLVTPAYSSETVSCYDAGFFGPLRHEYDKAVEELMKDGSLDEALTQTEVCNIMHQVYYKVITPMYAMKAFEERGFYPLNLDKVTDIFNVFKSDMSAPADEDLEDDVKLEETLAMHIK